MRAEGAATAVRLVVLSRAPVPGQTKTRLIPAFGAAAAAAFHAACLADILAEAEAWRQAGPPQGQARALTLCMTPPESWPDFARAGIVLPPGAALTVQHGDTLGERMAHALHAALGGATTGAAALAASQGGASAVTVNAALLVGSDLPLLSRKHLEAAGAALLEGVEPRADTVLGPADDGGYYLIGLRQPHPALFEGISWSTAHVAAQTRERATALGLSVAQLPSWYDVDTPADLARLRADLGTLPADVAPFTREFFARRECRFLPAAGSIASPTHSQLLSDSRR